MKIDGLVDANWEWFMNCQILEDVAFHRQTAANQVRGYKGNVYETELCAGEKKNVLRV